MLAHAKLQLDNLLVCFKTPAQRSIELLRSYMRYAAMLHVQH